MSLSRFVVPSIVALGVIASACGGGDSEAPSAGTAAPVVATSTVEPSATTVATAEPTPERAANVVVVTEETAVYTRPEIWGHVMAVIPAGAEVAVTGRAGESWWAVEDFGWVQGEPGSVFAAVDAPEVEPEVVSGLMQPAGVRTGVEFVDVVIELLLAEDVAALAELLVFNSMECAEQEPGMGALPQCPEGVSEGTSVELFEYASGLQRFVGFEQREWVLEQLFATKHDSTMETAVYSVLEGPTSADRNLMWFIPSAPYEITLRMGDGQIQRVKVSERGIEWFAIWDWDWTVPPVWMIFPEADQPVKYLLAPVVPAPLMPVPMVRAE